nr:hypothetical protein GCM10017745_46960 [Saccharothrix mutabilis subsp. capreolus]
MGAAAGGGVGQVGGGVQGRPPRGERVAPVPPLVVEGVQGPGEVPNHVVAAECGGGALGGQQGGVLGLQPCHRRRGVGQRKRANAGRARVGWHKRAVGVHEAVGGVGGVQVKVHHPRQRRLADVVRQGVGGGGGVGADQVVHPVPAARSPLHQRRLLQRRQRLAGVRRRQAGEGDDGGQGGVRAGGDTEQREHGALLFGEPVQGPGQHGGQAGGGIVVVERLQPECAEFGGDLGQRQGGADGGGAGGDRQGQGVGPAQRHQFVDGVGFGGGAVGGQARGQQGAGLVAVQDVQGQVAGAVPVDQRGQLAAAGDQDGAGWCAG